MPTGDYGNTRRSSRSARIRRARRRRRRRRILFTGALVLVLFIVFLIYGSMNIWYAKPKLTLLGETIQTIEAGTIYEDSGAMAMLGKNDISDQIVVTNPVDTSKASTQTILYSLEYRGQVYNVSRTVIVQDETPPQIVLSDADKEFKVSKLDDFYEPGVTAEDSAEGDVTSRVTTQWQQASETEWKLVYTVSDSSGNVATAERTVLIVPEDETKPRVNEGDSVICLTFDDGPSSKVTPRILDILKQYNVKATFFIVNYEDNMIPILERMRDEGHTIGIHTWDHDYNVCYATMDSYYEGVLKMAEKIKKDLNYEPYCIRFPGGSSNTVSRKYTEGVMSYLADLMPSVGYQYYDWNADSTDAEGNNRPAETLYANSISGFKQNRTNILLCHDIGTKETTADMLPDLIEYGLENGYRFEPITKSTFPVHHGINN